MCCMKKIFLVFLVLVSGRVNAQAIATAWADSVLKTLSPEEKIAQLMVVRLTERSANGIIYYDKQVGELVKKYNVGGICLFQGAPVWQATAVNQLQSMAKTPLLVCVDGEWGLGMRFDSIQSLPKQMMLGAVSDPSIVYKYGQIVAEQCRRAGIQVNYAPVVDINNNPDNPVINDRSFGEDKYKVAAFGIQYMKGMQDGAVMACAKHFPGHGDVSVDSHKDLPIINKTMEQLDSLELYPFREIFKAGVGSVMNAHLSIPAIDSTSNKPTSISYKSVTELLRNQLNYQGLTFTDALEMQGVKKFYPDGEASVQSLIAGNDMLCLPGDVPLAISKILLAIENKQLSWDAIDAHCKKVLIAKYQYGLAALKPINTENIAVEINSKVPAMKRLIAENALTVLQQTDTDFFPLTVPSNPTTDIVYLAVGMSNDNAFAAGMRNIYNADVLYFNYKQDSSSAVALIDLIKQKYKKVVIGIHNFPRVPANNFGMSKTVVNLVAQLQAETKSISFVFGNPYVIKNWCNAKNLVVCYEDDDIIQQTALDLLQGKIPAKGKLPVTVCEAFKYGAGIVNNNFNRLSDGNFKQSPDPSVKFAVVDSIALDAIARGATPGCVVLVVKDGSIAYHKAYGNYSYGTKEPVQLESVFDMASVTKICATTISVMKLYEEGKIDLAKTLGDYLPWVKGSNKASLKIEKVLLHQAGLVSYIPFYKEVIDKEGKPKSEYFSTTYSEAYPIRVAKDLFMQAAWRDTVYQRILKSPLGDSNKYVYSDNDFIFLGKVVEAVSGMTLDEYVQKTFYTPLGLTTAGFKPINRFPQWRVIPTEAEKFFRLQTLRGDVHDPGAAMFGGVAGHAGLFSNAYDLSVIMQMLMNGGTFNGKKYFNKETIDLFTAYHSSVSRRGYGFDKPEKDNATRTEPYPCLLASTATFGHTGFTGTCTWADPVNKIVYVFLSNRVNPIGGDNKKLLNLNVRPKIQDAIYKAFGL